MLFGPLRCEGDYGEALVLSTSLGKMTKEMRPAHRRDVLAHALVCYGMKKLGIDL